MLNQPCYKMFTVLRPKEPGVAKISLGNKVVAVSTTLGYYITLVPYDLLQGKSKIS